VSTAPPPTTHHAGADIHRHGILNRRSGTPPSNFQRRPRRPCTDVIGGSQTQWQPDDSAAATPFLDCPSPLAHHRTLAILRTETDRPSPPDCPIPSVAVQLRQSPDSRNHPAIAVNSAMSCLDGGFGPTAWGSHSLALRSVPDQRG
jgi:hypothetical protein